MENIGVVCFGCQTWMRHKYQPKEYSLIAEYAVTVVQDCPYCNPEKHDELEAQSK